MVWIAYNPRYCSEVVWMAPFNLWLAWAAPQLRLNLFIIYKRGAYGRKQKFTHRTAMIGGLFGREGERERGSEENRLWLSWCALRKWRGLQHYREHTAYTISSFLYVAATTPLYRVTWPSLLSASKVINNLYTFVSAKKKKHFSIMSLLHLVCSLYIYSIWCFAIISYIINLFL